MFSRAFQGSEREIVSTMTVGLPAGKYYIYIGADNWNRWSDVTYSFTVHYTSSDLWEKEWNDSLTAASAIPLNEEISGSTMESDDTDYYIVELPSDGAISVQFSHDYVESGENLWQMGLYTYNNTEKELITQYYTGSQRTPQTTTNIGLPAGKYYIAIRADNWNRWSDGDYRFTVQYYSSSVWEHEDNANRLSATRVPFNSEMRGSTMMSDDQDFFVFTLPEKDTVSFSFIHEYVDTNDSLWNLSVFNDSDVDHAILSVDYAGTGKEKLTTGEMDLSSGTYYLCVKGNNWNRWSPGPYTLTVNAKSQPGMPQRKYLINGITVQDTSGKALNAIPNGDFRATVSITNLLGGGESWVLLASYTKEGQFVDFTWARTKNFSVGGTFDLTVPIRNPSGKVGQLKAFTVSSLSNLTPLGNSASFPAV